MSTEKKIILKSSDGESFEIDETVAKQSETIKHMIEDNCTGDGIPLPNVTSLILAKVIEYCKKHTDAAAAAESECGFKGISGTNEDGELKAWDAEFVTVDQPILFDLILAANYLNIQGLLDLTCKTVADMMRGKTPEQIREHFNIVNDYSPEEEAEVRKENQWAFE
ncbi:unnamed protein product [Cochlearia groenlandica]